METVNYYSIGTVETKLDLYYINILYIKKYKTPEELARKLYDDYIENEKDGFDLYGMDTEIGLWEKHSTKPKYVCKYNYHFTPVRKIEITKVEPEIAEIEAEITP